MATLQESVTTRHKGEQTILSSLVNTIVSSVIIVRKRLRLANIEMEKFRDTVSKFLEMRCGLIFSFLHILH